jgi:ketosteroid isomerase-like protein
MAPTLEDVQRLIDAWNGRDLEAALELAAPEIVYVNSPMAVEPGTRHGRDEFASVLRAQWEFVGNSRLAIESLWTAGDDAFVLIRMSRTLHGSHTSVEAQIGMRLTYAAGQIARQEMMPLDDFDRARAAAGLAD